MNKKILLYLLLCAIPVAALERGGHPSTGGQAVTGIAFLMPQPTTDFSDVEARDAQNRPLKSASATEKLASLFRENIIDLTVFASLHPVTETMRWLDSISPLFNKSILLRLWAMFELLMDTFLPPHRRVVHNVDNLWITFSVGVLAGCWTLAALRFNRTPKHLYLRC